ncbi:hypothetical protein [uncultured Lacinutrix sp.]|uniref:hypothetical protein n=1 Tax=uncultured Lacinutrix sp. TaxID=574032 RepID=UPI0026030D37|nr:hypothetical protein [uncultured Lacinutrix sp.]
MTSKNKNIALLIGFLFVLILGYQYAISNTIALRKEFNSLKKQELLFKNAPKQLSILKQKEKYYDSLLVKYQINGSSIQNSLLKSINTFANTNSIQLISFLEPHVIQKDNLTYNTYLFTLQGNYNDILQLIYKLEQGTKFGEITNLHFERKKNYRTGKNYLQASVLMRSFG